MGTHWHIFFCYRMFYKTTSEKIYLKLGSIDKDDHDTLKVTQPLVTG